MTTRSKYNASRDLPVSKSLDVNMESINRGTQIASLIKATKIHNNKEKKNED